MTEQQEKDLNFQLVIYAGLEIVDRYLPTISIDMLKSMKVIQVTIGEADEFNRLQDIWWKSTDRNSNGITKEWIEMTDYRRKMEVKYLPKKLRCHIKKVTPTNMDEFMRGLIMSLWDCDLCNYHIERDRIEFKQNKEYSTVINLELQTEWEPWEIKN